MRYDGILRDVMRTATSEHEIVHAHADVFSVGLYAFVNEHASSFYPIHRTWFWFDVIWKKKKIKNNYIIRFQKISYGER